MFQFRNQIAEMHMKILKLQHFNFSLKTKTKKAKRGEQIKRTRHGTKTLIILTESLKTAAHEELYIVSVNCLNSL